MPDNILVFVRTDGGPGLPGRVRPVNQHHRFLMVSALEGSGSAFVNGGYFGIAPGQGMLVFPHQLHYFLYDTPDILWVMISFDADSPEQYAPLRDRLFLLSDEARDTLVQIGARYSALQRAQMLRDGRLSLLTALLLDEVCDKAGVEPPAKIEGKNVRAIDLVERINQYINAHLQRNPGIDELARAFSYSPSRLRQLYRQTTGLTLGAYSEHIRMHRAQAYLLASGLNVSETAERCGYDSLYTFCRAFKRYHGCSPTQYRSGGRSIAFMPGRPR